MPSFPAPIESRLPNVGTTIFTVMSRLAQECGAINLSQGFPDFNAEDVLFERVAHWMRAGHNQYAPMAGTAALRAAIAAKVEALYGTATLERTMALLEGSERFFGVRGPGAEFSGCALHARLLAAFAKVRAQHFTGA